MPQPLAQRRTAGDREGARATERGQQLGVERHRHATVEDEVDDTHTEGLVTLSDCLGDCLGLVLEIGCHDLVDDADDDLVIGIILETDGSLEFGDEVPAPRIILRIAALDGELLGLLDVDRCDRG